MKAFVVLVLLALAGCQSPEQVIYNQLQYHVDNVRCAYSPHMRDMCVCFLLESGSSMHFQVVDSKYCDSQIEVVSKGKL